MHVRRDEAGLAGTLFACSHGDVLFVYCTLLVTHAAAQYDHPQIPAAHELLLCLTRRASSRSLPYAKSAWSSMYSHLRFCCTLAGTYRANVPAGSAFGYATNCGSCNGSFKKVDAASQSM